MKQNLRNTSVLTVIFMSVVMMGSQGLSNAAFAEPAQESDSVGDIHIRATFQMSNITFENNSFKIFDQVSGYKD